MAVIMINECRELAENMCIAEKEEAKLVLVLVLRHRDRQADIHTSITIATFTPDNLFLPQFLRRVLERADRV